MDIEKICRTCLALSGPLMSIFVGSSGGASSGCVADMLRDFTKMNPKVADNMPDKVCLACISEINRCYSFKMKCENANNTLRQLLPDAVEEVDVKIEHPKNTQQKHVGVQTIPESKKNMIPAQVQTSEKAVQRLEKEVQTDMVTIDMATSPLIRKPSKQEPSGLFKREADKEPNDLHKTHTKDQQSSDSQCLKEIKLRRLEIEDTLELGEEQEILYELQSEFGPENTSNENEIEAGIQSDSGMQLETGVQSENGMQLGAGEANATEYYVYDESQPDDEYENNRQYTSAEHAPQSPDSDEEPPQQANFKFTVIQTEEGNEEITTSELQIHDREPQNIHKQLESKVGLHHREFKCRDCPMFFVHVKNLLRHCLRMHKWSQQELGMLEQTMSERQKKKQQHAREIKQEEEPQLHEAEDVHMTENLRSPILHDLHEVIEREEQNKITDQQMLQTRSDMNNQTNSKPIEPTVFCSRCNAGFAFLKSLNYHMKQNQCTTVTFSCNECQRVFTSKEGFEEHRESHLLQHACNECNLAFVKRSQLSEHLIKIHNRSPKNQCNVCNKVFTMTSALKDHLRIHTGEKPFLCPTCGKGFRQNCNLKQHVMRHSNIKPYNCDLCSLNFVSKSELISHKRTHTGDHPYPCDICNASYTTSSSLVKHKRKHTGERPYACDFCPMRFTALNVLKNHRRTHTGEKPYECVYCNKGFSQKSDCQIHQRTHTGEKRYTCICGDSFTHLSTMRMHEKLHHNAENGDILPHKRRKTLAKAAEEMVTGSEQPKIMTTFTEFDVDEDTLQEQDVRGQDDHNDDDETTVVNAASTDEEYITLAMDDI